MLFKKGNIPWNKGIKISDGAKQFGFQKGNKFAFKKGYTPWNKDMQIDRSKYPNWGSTGTKLSQSQKEKIGAYWRGRKRGSFSDEHKRKLRENHSGMSGKTVSQKTRDKISKMSIGRLVSEETRSKLRKRFTGENGPGWKGGLSFEPYSPEFNKGLKEKIKKRDNYRCQECSIAESESTYKLRIHHIDYNKNNNQFDNLVSLCHSCHSKTNWSREKWTKYYQNKIEKIYA